MLGPTTRDQKPLPRLPQDAGVPVSNGGPELPIPLPYPVPISTIGLELHRRSCYVALSPFAAPPYISGPSQVSEDPEGRIRHPFAFLHTLTCAPHSYCDARGLLKPAKIQMAGFDTVLILAHVNTRPSPLLRVRNIRHGQYRILYFPP
jgi:hypothetical protein